MRHRLHSARSRSAVVRRQDQRHLRADASSEEAQELQHDEEENVSDTNAFAETGCIPKRDAQGQHYAQADELAESNCFADLDPRGFCNADTEELSIAFGEKGRQKEGFTESFAERHTVSFT